MDVELVLDGIILGSLGLILLITEVVMSSQDLTKDGRIPIGNF
jgi:hypothetical protein